MIESLNFGSASALQPQWQAREGASGLGARIHAGVAALLTRWRIRKAARDLERLDDRMLRDIGVSRTEIGHVVRHGRGVRGRDYGTTTGGGAGI
jgi:uncharacterized protein YjiS (DUF1127 family)